MKFPWASVEQTFPDHFEPKGDEFNKNKSAEDRAYERSRDSFAACIGVSRPRLNQLISRGWVGPKLADRIAVNNGVHPTAIWPAEWNQYLEETVYE